MVVFAKLGCQDQHIPLLTRTILLRYSDDWVIVAKGKWQAVIAQIFGNLYIFTLLKLEGEQFLVEFDNLDQTLAVVYPLQETVGVHHLQSVAVLRQLRLCGWVIVP